MISEKIVVGKGSKYPLDGVLTLPESEIPVPGVVFVHGSGASNMDEGMGKLTPFKDLAEGLAKYGIASIRYDKRTFAHGKELVNEKNITVKEETIEDAVLATNLLKRDARIDSKRIFIVGHSMGAMLAPRIDAEGGKYHGLVMLAGSPRKLEELMTDQNEAAISQMNFLAKMTSKKSMQQMKETFDLLYKMSDKEAKSRAFSGGTTLYYLKEMGMNASPKYLKNMHKPMLIMQGGKDFQVSVEKDFNGYKELLKDRENVTFKLYEDLNHAFVPSVYGKILKAKQEYDKEQHIGEDVIGDIANWILQCQ